MLDQDQSEGELHLAQLKRQLEDERNVDNPVRKVFSRDVIWKPHPFMPSSNPEDNTSNSTSEAGAGSNKDMDQDTLVVLHQTGIEEAEKAMRTNRRTSYADICPNGGPGGLICCTDCTSSYSKFLTFTFNDMQDQMTAKVANEMEQVLGFLESAKANLSHAVRAARRQNPPLPAEVAAVTTSTGNGPAAYKRA